MAMFNFRHIFPGSQHRFDTHGWRDEEMYDRNGEICTVIRQLTYEEVKEYELDSPMFEVKFELSIVML